MLYPITTETRTVASLNGVWRFRFDPTRGRDGEGFAKRFFERPLENAVSMPVPSAWNDLFETQSERDFVGWVWYETEFVQRDLGDDANLVLRFGSVTHRAKVYVNGSFVTEHVGGFTPFEAVIDEHIRPGVNRLTVAVCTILDYSTLPIGTYSETELPDGSKKIANSPNFDFFNYTGIQRPVVLYSVPRSRITDITVVPTYSGTTGTVEYSVATNDDQLEVSVEVVDETGTTVASADGASGSITIPDVKLWSPRAAYLYAMAVTARRDGKVVDVYREPFGVRTVEVRDGRFLINSKLFYFKGFGKHEDAAIRGRGLDDVFNVKDLRLIKWMGGNSLRTSHYCYSEEFMRLCDREGIVVIDEVPAVGLMLKFSFDLSGIMNAGAPRPKTWETVTCADAHHAVIREMIARDKNHPCVVMWSLTNESESWEPGAGEYFAPLFELTREIDPAKRPVTGVLMQSRDISQDEVAPLSDVVCINRYYGWYFSGGDLATAKVFLEKELAQWHELYPDKPIIVTEYGADTIAGFHDTGSVMFTEEYQAQYYEANHEVFDRFPLVVGEHAWNFADFATAQNIMRAQGNKKGLFTRDRQPKQAVFAFKQRWEAIPDLGHEK